MSIVTLNDRAVRSVTAFGSLNTGSMVFIKKLTASSSGTLSFVNGASSVVFDSTYKEYLFTFKDIHPSADGAEFQFQGSTNTGSSYGVTMTSTSFIAYHDNDDSYAALSYDGDRDIAQGTGFKILLREIGSANDESGVGFLRIFNPSSTTFVKNFLAVSNDDAQTSGEQGLIQQCHVAGYFNTQSAINAIRFDNDGGNIDAGNIILYGIN